MGKFVGKPKEMRPTGKTSQNNIKMDLNIDRRRGMD
jgi:hypothetical protein